MNAATSQPIWTTSAVPAFIPVTRSGKSVLQLPHLASSGISNSKPHFRRQPFASQSSLDLTSESTFVGAAADVATTTATVTPTVFEPIAPSTTILAGMGLIVVLCVAVAWVWQNQVVPISRTNLALSKAKGPVKEYLDDLREADAHASANSNSNASTNSSTSASSAQNDEDVLMSDVDEVNSENNKTTNNSRAFERWLFTDWLLDNKSERKAGRQKEAALPILKDAKWNSGDNPVLAATLLISLGVLLTAVTERVSTLVS